MNPPQLLETREDIKKASEAILEGLKKNTQCTGGQLWTDNNFTWLRSLLPEYLNCFHGKRKDHSEDTGEFMWDFIAYHPETGIYLAAESEQYTGSDGKKTDLNHDFEKLLYVYAPLRLMICKCRDGEEAYKIRSQLNEYAQGSCRNFNPGAVFLLHCWFTDGTGSASFSWQSDGDPAEIKSEKFELK